MSPCAPPPVSAAGKSGVKGLPDHAGLALCLLLTGLALTLDGLVAHALDLRPFPAFASFARAMSRMGEGWVAGAVGLLSAALLALWGRPKLARVLLVVTFATLLTGATATMLRVLVGRTRPNARMPQGVYGVRHNAHWILGEYDFGSFPSGHAATAFGLVAALWLANRRAGLAATPYAVLVSWSRVAQGSHHFSDVVAAACLGMFGGRFFAARLDPILQTATRALRLAPLRSSDPTNRSETTPWPGCLAPTAPAATIARLRPAGGGVPAPLVSVVIPCYNEQDNLGPLTAAIARAVEPLAITWEVLVTDDCSTDKSWQVVTGLATADPRIRGQRLAHNSGQSAALWAGIKAARGRFLATMDADLQNAPGDLPEGCIASCRP